MLKWARTRVGRWGHPAPGKVGIAALLLVATIASAMIFGGGAQPARGDAGTATGTSGQTSPLTDDQAVSIGRAISIQSGEAAPSAIEVVRSTHARALNQIDPGERTGADDSLDVLVLVLHGHFTASLNPHPPQSPPPTGSTMTLVLDAATGQILDLGIVDAAPSLAPLGAVRQITG